MTEDALSAEERALWYLGRDDFWQENSPERFSPDAVLGKLDAVEDVLWRLGGLDAVELWALDLGDRYRLDLVTKDAPSRLTTPNGRDIGYRLGNYVHRRVVGLIAKDKIEALAKLWGGVVPRSKRSNYPRYEGAKFSLVSYGMLLCAVREAGKRSEDVYL